jgi:uncharacterized membrane protein
MSAGRLQSYVDAILAIAATLLILNVTAGGSGTLAHRLVHSWPSYAAYAVSFLTIGVIWINHHAILRLVEQPDPLFVIQNLLLLLFVGFLPFPTHVFADALRTGDGANAAAVFYGISATLMAASFNALWIYASHGRRLLRADASDRVVTGITRSFRPGILLYAAATVVGVFSAWASAAIYAGITLFYVVSGSALSREPRRRE